MERHSDNLDTHGHSSCILQVIPDQFCDRILIVTLIVEFIFSGHSHRLAEYTHPQDIEDVGVSSQK